jgi:hypothetical protein
MKNQKMCSEGRKYVHINERKTQSVDWAEEKVGGDGGVDFMRVVEGRALTNGVLKHGIALSHKRRSSPRQ